MAPEQGLVEEAHSGSQLLSISNGTSEAENVGVRTLVINAFPRYSVAYWYDSAALKQVLLRQNRGKSVGGTHVA